MAVWNRWRTALGWGLLVVFLALVSLWTLFGFSPQLVGDVQEPLASFGRVDAWWPILFAALVAVGAAWALAPSLRTRAGRGAGEDGASLRLWAAVVLGVSSLLMMFAAYWPCAGVATPVWSALRRAAEAFGDTVAEPFGTVKGGCPALFPQGLLAGVLFGKAAVVLISALALAHIFRDTLDGVKARWARQVVIFAGLSDETLGAMRAVASNLTNRQTILVVDAGPELERAKEIVRDVRREFARDRKRSRAIALQLDTSDIEAVQTFVRSRGGRGIQGLYLMSPDAVSNLRALDVFLSSGRPPKATPASEAPGRVLVRVDDPWHAEDWRRQQMIGNPGWLFDALSVREVAARHVVIKLKQQKIDRVVITGATSFSLAILAELSFEHRVDAWLESVSAAAKARSRRPDQFVDYVGRTPQVVLVGSQAKEIAETFRCQLQRFGIGRSADFTEVRELEDFEAAMERLTQEGLTPALVAGVESGYDSTFLAVRHPRWAIFDWDQSVRGMTDRPLLGQLWIVGPTLEPSVDFGLDIWDRLGAVQHWTYVLNSLDGQAATDDPNGKRGIWKSLSPFAKESNIRTFATFTRGVANLSEHPRRLGTDLSLGGTEIESPLEGDEVFLDLAEREHESWRRHHEEYGFKWGPQRKGKRHPDMRDWSELGAPERQKDIENVHTADELLRALGFVLVSAK